jgi:hypothetical protein
MISWIKKDRTPMGMEKRLDKEGNMMKIIERLQKNVQTHREDNKNLMKSREQ